MSISSHEDDQSNYLGSLYGSICVGLERVAKSIVIKVDESKWRCVLDSNLNWFSEFLVRDQNHAGGWLTFLNTQSLNSKIHYFLFQWKVNPSQFFWMSPISCQGAPSWMGLVIMETHASEVMLNIDCLSKHWQNKKIRQGIQKQLCTSGLADMVANQKLQREIMGFKVFWAPTCLFDVNFLDNFQESHKTNP